MHRLAAQPLHYPHPTLQPCGLASDWATLSFSCTETPQQPPAAGQCSDTTDNDSDGLIDSLDPDCSATAGLSESPAGYPPPPPPPPGSQCYDSLDNDGDGLEDFLDPDCTATGGFSESPGGYPPPPPPPSRPPEATLGIHASPSFLHRGATTQIHWAAQHVTSCTVTGTNGGSWSGTVSPPETGQRTSAIRGETRYTLRCKDLEGNTKSKTARVSIIPVEDEITDERFALDQPSGVRDNAREFLMNGVRGTRFDGKNAAMGDTVEVWVNDGYLYEIATYKRFETWLDEILETWQFI